MKYKIYFLISILIMLSCSSKSTIYLSGLNDSIGAIIFIDGENYGTMEDVGNGANKIVRIRKGKHHLIIINTKGHKYEKTFYVKGENYISVMYEIKK